jgi:hypothetical protein
MRLLVNNVSSSTGSIETKNKSMASYLMQAGTESNLDHSRLFVYSVGNSGKHKVVRRKPKNRKQR